MKYLIVLIFSLIVRRGNVSFIIFRGIATTWVFLVFFIDEKTRNLVHVDVIKVRHRYRRFVITRLVGSFTSVEFHRSFRI